jgi:Putative Ig domain
MKRLLPFVLIVAWATAAFAARPKITSPSTATGQVGVAFSYQITADQAIPPGGWSATGLPAGLSVNTTGLISGIPAAGADAGSPYTVTLTATNSNGTSNPATLTLTIKPPPPVITSSTTPTGQACVAFSYTITATNNPTSYGASGLPAFLTISGNTISGAPNAPGTFTFTVSATNAGGTGSATVTLTVGNAPTPTITSPLTATGTVGTAFTYTIVANPCITSYNATGLPAGLSVNTTTGVISGTPTTAGIYSVAISATNSGGSDTKTLTLTINNPIPTTTSLGPACVTAGSADFTLTVTGTKFVSTSTVNWNGTALTTTFISSTQLTALVPAADVATPGPASITVVNPSPGGGTSGAQTFTIAATPAINSQLTACGTVGVAFSYTITATNNPTSFTASPLPAGLNINTSTGVISGTPTTAGTTNVTVTASNGATSCSTSAQQTLVITIGGKPTITSLSQTCVTAGSTDFILTVTGTNFVSGSVVNWNGTGLTTTFVTSTQLTATVPAANVATAGTVSVTVVNPCAGATSTAAPFTVTPVPSITSLSQTCVTAGSAKFTLTVNGTNFVSGSVVSWNGTGLTTTFVSSSQLTATVPAANVATAGTVSVTVVNPNPCGATSTTATFTITPKPTIASISPACIAAASPGFTLTVNGTGFVSGSVVNWNGTGLTTTFVSSTQLTAAVPAANVATAGMASITVVNPCAGATSSATQFTIAAPSVITSTNTAAGTVGVAFSYQITPTSDPTSCSSPSSYNATGLPPGLSVNTSTGLISGTPTTAGIYQVTLSATNAAGTGTATLIITIGPFTATGTTGVAFSYQIPATGNPTSYNATGLPAGLAVDMFTGLISGTPTAAGTYSVTISATYGGGASAITGNGTLTLTINLAPPVITSATTATGTVGTAFSYTITATNSPASYGVSGSLPPGLKQGTGSNKNQISGTPTTAGIYMVTISATNASGTGTATLVITIGPFTAAGTVNTAFSYQIPASGTPASYNATGLPSGLTVNTTTGLISGTTSAVGAFSVNISATYGTGSSAITGSGTLALTITFSDGSFSPPFPGEKNDFDTGSTQDPRNDPNFTIPFPNATTDNYFELYWNAPGATNQNPRITDLARGGLQRNADTVGMKYNPYDPTNPNSKPDPTKNVWRGNPSPPNDNTSGQFGDPRASWYLIAPWPTADYVTSSYWGGPTPQVVPLNWPDSGHNFSNIGIQPSGAGQTPTDIMAGPTPTPDPDTKSISRLSTSTSGNLNSITELGNVFDPSQLNYTVTNAGGALPDIPSSATTSSTGGGGHTLAIGRPEFSAFDKNGTRAWQLLDVFSANSGTIATTNTTGLVNVNTASRDVLRSLAAGVLENRDNAIQPTSLQNNLYPPTVSSQADLFADAVINSRPLLSTAALSAIRVTPPGGSQPEPFFGNPHQYNNQTAPSEWNDIGREELFAKIYNLATTRSRNFRVFVTGQSLDKNGNVLSTVTKVYQVFVKPTRAADGTIQKDATGTPIQQVVIKYEGSM